MSQARNEISAAAFAKVGSCGSPSFSPDGKLISFVSNLNGIPQIWIVPTAGGFPQLVTALDDQISKVKWSPNGEWLAFNLAPGGGMNQQIYLIRPDGTGLKRLSDGGTETNWLDYWTSDSTKLVAASNRISPDGMDLYLIDIESGAFERLAQNRGTGEMADLSPGGRLGVLYRVENRSDSNLFLIDFASGVETLLSPHDPPGNFTAAQFSKDGQTIYITSDQNLEQIAFAAVKLDVDGKPGAIEVIVSREDAELQEFALTHDGTMAMLVWNASGLNELVLIDLVTHEQTPIERLPSEVIYDIAFSADDTLLTFVATGSIAPRDVWVYERSTQTMRQITHSPHPGINLDSLVKPELVRFPASDGLELSGWLYRPQGADTPGACVVSFHGGPEGQERPQFSSTYQALLAEGIAVFAPNVRGSGGFGKTFVNLDNGALRVNAIRDILDCVNYILNVGIADPNRVGIMGGSYGGYMTMMGLAEYPDLFRAGANLYGVVNFKTFFAQTEPWMAAISKIEYGDPDTEGEMLDSLSPIYKIDRVKAPTLVLHGANDTNVPVVEAEQVVDNLARRGIPVEYVLFPDEGHGFLKERNRIRATEAIVSWFVQHL